MTILFTDLVGSTAMGDRLGDVDAEGVRRRFFAIVEEAVEPTGGRIVKNLGDGHMVAFVSALDAVGCGIAIQAGVDAHNSEVGVEQIAVRVGINAGDVSLEGEDYFGTPVTIAKRLCDSAVGGQILISGLVASLVGSRGTFAFRDIGSLELRGLSRPQAASEVIWRNPDAEFARLAAAAGPTKLSGGTGGRPLRLLAAAAAIVVLGAIATALVVSRDDEPGRPSSGDAVEPRSGNSELLDVSGTVPTMDRQRVHTFEGYAGDVVHVEVTSLKANVDLLVELRNEAGTLLAFDDDNGNNGDPGLSAFELPRDGQYLVAVRLYRPAQNGPYALTVTRSDGPAVEALDRGFGEFVTHDDEYTQEVRTTEDEKIDVVVRSETVNRADLFLELLDPDGQVVASDDDSGDYDDPLIKRFRAPSSGTYTVRLSGVPPDDLGAFRVDIIRR